MSKVVVYGGFDGLQAPEIRLLEEAAKHGDVTVLLWPDKEVARLSGRDVQFPMTERVYWLEAIRYVTSVVPLAGQVNPEELPMDTVQAGDTWVLRANEFTPPKDSFAHAAGLKLEIVPEHDLLKLPDQYDPLASGVAAEDRIIRSPKSGAHSVVVTGCYDWFHTGHIRFFEEVSELGDLYVVLGHDANVRELKGEGHPMFPDFQRWYMVQSIRYVTRAMISSGDGWLDAEPEIRIIQPDIYAVNEDGDKPVKRAFCEANGIEYVVLKRTPKEGLKPRSSTDLRGF